MRNRRNPITPTANDPYEEAQVPTKIEEPEVDLYADEPYVSPSIKRAMAGEQVAFGNEVTESTDTDI